jgi:hypothetical protein
MVEEYNFPFKPKMFLNAMYNDIVPHRKHITSATEPNRLMLFGETVAVYCENHTKHTDTARTSQETRYASSTKPNR